MYEPRKDGGISVYNITSRSGRVIEFNYQELNNNIVMERVSYRRKEGFSVEELFDCLGKRFKESFAFIDKFIKAQMNR